MADSKFHEIRALAKEKFDEHGVATDNPLAWHMWKFAFQQGYLAGEKGEKSSLLTKKLDKE